MTTTEKITESLRASMGLRWTALLIVSAAMMFGYFFTDVMSPLEPMLTAESGVEGGLGWSSSEYGFFSGSYSFFNVFLGLLFLGGIILDKLGIRFTGVLSTLLMFSGALIKFWALNGTFEGTVWMPIGGGDYGFSPLYVQTQVALAALGFAIYGVGCEICGITVSKIIVKWFTGYELALALGVQVGLARLGTAAALQFALPFAAMMGSAAASVGLGAALLCASVLIMLVYNVMDRKLDRTEQSLESEPEEALKLSDIKFLVTNRGFWYIALLCLMFYAGVFQFLKFATKIMVVKYGVSQSVAGGIPAMLPYGTIVLTPLFGYVYDKIGKGATLMIIGSVLLTLVHACFALPVNHVAVAIVLMLVLGVAFGLVPSAMWPSVPKIIPMQVLGTAYSLIFFIQNIGLMMVPIVIGAVNGKNTDASGFTDYTQSLEIFAGFGVIAVIISLLLLREDRVKKYGLQDPNIKK